MSMSITTSQKHLAFNSEALVCFPKRGKDLPGVRQIQGNQEDPTTPKQPNLSIMT